MNKTRSKDNLRAFISKKIADNAPYSRRFVDMVTDGSRKNEKIMGLYMELNEGINDLVDNKLLDAVNELVPFSPKKTAK